MALCNEGQVNKHDTYHHSHGCGAYQENITIFKLFRWGEFKYKAIVYASFSPHEYVASIQKQMEEQEAKHAAKDKMELVVKDHY